MKKVTGTLDLLRHFHPNWTPPSSSAASSDSTYAPWLKHVPGKHDIHDEAVLRPLAEQEWPPVSFDVDKDAILSRLRLKSDIAVPNFDLSCLSTELPKQAPIKLKLTMSTSSTPSSPNLDDKKLGSKVVGSAGMKSKKKKKHSTSSIEDDRSSKRPRPH